MKRTRVYGLPVLLFTRQLSARRWDFTTVLDGVVDERHWSVALSPKSRIGAAIQFIPWVQVHIERADGRIEGLWSSDPSSRAVWSYTRTVNLDGSEPPPSLVVHESLLPRRLAFVRRRLPGAK
jgi:hypothetical protein